MEEQNNPKVIICMSTYNGEKYVKEQIEKYKNKDIDYSEVNNEIIYHILNIDEHKPFTNNKINNFTLIY